MSNWGLGRRAAVHLAAFALALVLFSEQAMGAAVVWNVNGHTYEAVRAPGISWDAARSACTARGGYLATLTSAEEHAFVAALISNDSALWAQDPWNDLGPWLGGIQPPGSTEPSGGWTWVTGEPWSYTNWQPTNPDNCCGGQDKLRFIRRRGTTTCYWDDCETSNPSSHRTGYIFESCASTTDTDEDGLADCWEEPTLPIPTLNGVPIPGSPYARYRLSDSNPLRKDLFLEVDALSGHAPSSAVLGAVVGAFANAPVLNADNSTGITLHITGQSTPGVDDIVGSPSLWNLWADFDSYKSEYFGTASERVAPNWSSVKVAKQQAYRYCVFASDIGGPGGQARGIPATDFVVAQPSSATQDEVAGTFMHELGHALGLRHGGGDDINGKPNYYSVMNYVWQMPVRLNSSCGSGSPSGALQRYASSWVLDYSRSVLAPLDENNLSDQLGLAGDPNVWVPVGPLAAPGLPNIVPMGSPVDWNRDGVLGTGFHTGDANYLRDCIGSSAPSPGQVLYGHDDWVALSYAVPATTTIRARELVADELTFEQFLELGSLRPDCDGDGIEDAEEIAAGTSQDVDGNGIPDTCEDLTVVGTGDPIREEPGVLRIVGSGGDGMVRFGFTLERSAENVVLCVYDLRGRRLVQLAHGAHDDGEHIVSWRLVDDAGTGVSGGVYFAELRVGDSRYAKKFVLLR